MDQAKAGSRNKEDWTSEQTTHAIANGMPWIYGFMRDPDRDARTIIENYARKQGFDSLAQLKSSLDEIREQLRTQLSEKEWQAYFKGTEDIQLWLNGFCKSKNQKSRAGGIFSSRKHKFELL